MSEYDKVRSIIDECLESDVVSSDSEQLSGSVYLGCVTSKFKELKDTVNSAKKEIQGLPVSDGVLRLYTIGLTKVCYKDNMTNFIFGTNANDYYTLSVLCGDDDAFINNHYADSSLNYEFRNYAKHCLPIILKYARKMEEFSQYFVDHTVFTAEGNCNRVDFMFLKKMKIVFMYDDSGNYKIGLGIDDIYKCDPNDLFNKSWVNREKLFDYARNNVNAILQRVKVSRGTMSARFSPIIDEAFTKCALPELEVPKSKVLTCKRN